MATLSHIDDQGRAAMVDVGDKNVQRRRACARGTIRLNHAALAQVRDHQNKKGDVLVVAQIAGIQAAKRTATLIPLCHPLSLDRIQVTLQVTDLGITAQSQVDCHGRTGVEMEALTAVSVALLTVYDMCKAVDHTMCIETIHLLEKVKSDGP
jgi:cyclic pyranopterin phosphate synthase